MGDRRLETLLEGGSFFEGPRWRDGRWWVSDFYRHLVLSVTPDGETEEIMTVEGQPSGLGWMPDGSLLVVSMKEHRILRRSPDGEVTVHADVSEHCGGHLNDLVVDGQGRAYAGNFGFDMMGRQDPSPTVITRVDPGGGVHAAAEDMLFPNGMVITPDGGTLIAAESMGFRLTAFTMGGDGSLADRRVWAQPGPERVVPDGCCLDTEGCIWAADAMGGQIVRVAEGGEITDEVRAPDGLGFYACMLGGEDGRTLLICAAPDFFEQARKAAREAILLTTRVEVPHAGLP